MKNNNNLEQDEIKKDDTNDKSIIRKLYDEFKIGVNKNYKVLILITIVTLLILYMIYPNACNIKGINRNNIIGGGPRENISMLQEQGNMGNGNVGEGKKKSFIGKFSPLSGGISIMTWVAKNILLLYLVLIFIAAIPSVPILLYITVFYFIMSGMFGKLYTL
jgi:hypothetical protein